MQKNAKLKKEIEVDGNEAIVRLINVASAPTGQGRKAANFLLAWWDADSCGGFNLADLATVDLEITADMLAVIGMIALNHAYPDELGYAKQFECLARYWRPNLSSEGKAN